MARSRRSVVDRSAPIPFSSCPVDRNPLADRGSFSIARSVRFSLHSAGKRANCTPDVWLDGQRVKGLEVDELLPQDIEAMELYETIAGLPFEFTPPDASVPCGTIVIWTRIPGR